MNKYAMAGIVAAVIVTAVTAGSIGIFAMTDADANMHVREDTKNLVADMQENAEGIDPGYGQVTQKEGAYSP